MMEIFLTVVTFILGFFAEKLLDYMTAAFSQKISLKKAETKFDNFYTRPHKDIKITASGFPFFSPNMVNETLNKEATLLLAMPNEAGTASRPDFSSEDDVTDAFTTFISENALQETLEKLRVDTFEDFLKRENGNYFNGKLLGIHHIDGLSRTTDYKEAPILSVDFFKTDYFTHKIMEKLIATMAVDQQKLLSDAPHLYSWSRTSFGVSVILILPKQNEIILTKRSNRAAYSENKEWIYVSVTETLSETDYNEDTGNPDILKCVLRGINEELGLTQRQLKLDTLRFYDTFYETHFHQDNIVASIEVSENLTFSEIYSLLAKDKYMEVADIVTIPNNEKAITTFIEQHKEEMRAQTIFSLESFVARK